MKFQVPTGTHIVPGVGCVFEGDYNTEDEAKIAILKAYFKAQESSAPVAEDAPAPVVEEKKSKKSTILTTDGFVDAGIAKPVKE